MVRAEQAKSGAVFPVREGGGEVEGRHRSCGSHEPDGF